MHADTQQTLEGEEFQVSNSSYYTQFSSITSLNDGGYIVVWSQRAGPDPRGVFGQRYNADGTESGTEFRITADNIPYTFRVDITELTDGGWVATWVRGGAPGFVFGQRYNADGTQAGNEFEIGYGYRPSIAPLNDGGFVVTWQDWSSERDIYGQRYSADGSLSGESFRVNSYSNGNQTNPSVTSLSDGGFLVTWDGVYGQRYSADGAAIGNEFQVNTLTTGGHTFSALTALNDGRFVVTWGGNEIGGQIFSLYPVESPIAQDDMLSTTEDFASGGNILLDNGNGADSDPDGEILSVTAVNGNAANVGTSVMLASGATIIVNADGRFVYDPNGAFENLNQGDTATDSFTYTIADAQGVTDMATVTLTINGEEDGIVVTGGSGNQTGTGVDDYIAMSDGDDTVHGGAGYDYLQGFAGDDLLFGEADSDWLDGGANSDTLDGGAGNDWLVGDAGADLILGQSGSDTITLGGSTHHTVGYVAYNVSSATQTGTQVRISLAGKVKIEAVIDGGSEFDTIRLSDESDAFFLHDAYSGFHSSVALTGDYTGRDSAARFNNIEQISGLGGDDIIDLTSPDYSLAGQYVSIDGGTGNDVIWGSDADEVIFGGTGNDTLFGGIGTDTLEGGVGADVFEFTRTSTTTSVLDFNPTEGDMLRFYNTGGAQFDSASMSLTSDGITISYTDAATSQIHELNIALAETADQFTLTLADIQGAFDVI